MKKTIVRIFCAMMALLLAGCSSAASPSSDTSSNGTTKSSQSSTTKKPTTTTNTQADSGEKGKIYTLSFDLMNRYLTDQDVQYDTIKFVVSLQGLLNREKPTLFVMDGTSQRWFNYLREDEEKLLYGYKQTGLGTIRQLIKAFTEQIKDFGLVVWDKNLPATANVAATVCGVEGYLPVMYSEDKNGMYRILTEEFGVEIKMDLRGKFTGKGTVWQTDRQSTGSAKCDAYIWAIEKYVKTGKTSPDYVGFMGDAYPLTTGNTPAFLGGSVYELFLPDHVFMIARKAFIFDLSPWTDETPIDDPNQALGTDYAVMCELLTLQAERNNGKISQCIGYVPFAYKYSQGNGSSHGPVDAEWRTTEILTAHNIALQADCPGPSSMWNCSLYQHYPLKESYKQVSNKNPELPTFNPNKKYVYLYLGDYDAASWTASVGAGYWDNPVRGQMPFNWAFNPNLSDRIPMFFDYIYSTATENDYFTAGDSGAGYVNPTLFEEGKRIHSTLPDATQAWVDWCTPLYKKFDVDTTGFVLNGNHGMISEKMMAAYQQFSPRGIAVSGSYNPQMFGDMPVVEAYGLGTVGGTAVTVNEAIEGIRSAVSRSRSLPFYHIRTVVVSPYVLFEAAKRLKDIDPSIEFLDAYTYYGMIARELQK